MTTKENVFRPFLEEQDFKAVEEALKMEWLSQGSYTQQFESEVQKLCQAPTKYPVGASTGFAALHLALVLAGVKEGDEVITPSLNNVADFQAIEHTGGSIVFCDIKEETLCIDLDKAEELITPKTKALIIIDYACWKADYEKAEQLAKKYNIRIIHDAAHSFGWKHNGKMVGSFSDLLMFSFDPVKTITCIDGGILMTSSEEEARLAQELRIMGMGQPTNVNYNNKRAWSYDVKHKGYRYHLANSHAALGLSQLKKIDSITEKRKAIFSSYTKALSSIAEITIPNVNLNDIIPLLYVIQVPQEVRDTLRMKLKENGIETGIHWRPGHLFSYFKNNKSGPLPVTEKVYETFLSLPMHPQVKEENIQLTAQIIKQCCSNKVFATNSASVSAEL